MRILIFLFTLFTCSPVLSQMYLNLDFETNVYPTLTPKKWELIGKGYRMEMDSLFSYSGNYSLAIKKLSKNDSSVGRIACSFPNGFLRTHKVKLSAKLKVNKSNMGKAGIYINVLDGEGNIIKSADTLLTKYNKDEIWFNLSLEMDIPLESNKVIFGGTSSANICWFDDFEIRIDGDKYQETIPPMIIPTHQELEWLKNKVIPIRSVEPTEANDDDLTFLKEILQGSRVVALGEVTHGSSEIFKMKHRIIKYLRRYLGFDIFSIEGNMSEAYKLNDYILDNKGDPQTLIGGMRFWTWYTKEMLDLVKWMNAYNKKHDDKIRYTGFDMQSEKGPLSVLKANADGQMSQFLEKLEVSLDSAKAGSRGNLNLAEYYKKNLDSLKDWYTVKFKGNPKKEWILQNIRILEQLTDNANFSRRDRYMAENVSWIMDQNPDSKLILWSHNGHIKKTGTSMGKYLKNKYLEEYLSVGFAFYDGEYTANDGTEVKSFPAERAYPGTYEFFFNSIQQQIFLIDLRNLDANDERQKWLFDNLGFRQTGALKVEEEFYDTSITSDFDFIIFMQHSSASELLKPKKN